MTKVTYIRLMWAGGVHRFELNFNPATGFAGFTVIPQLHDRVRAILDRLVTGQWGAEDVSNPVRLGLMGGGDFKPDRKNIMEPWREVDALVSKHVLQRPLGESVALAQTILLAAIVGVDPALADRGLAPVAVSLDDAVDAVVQGT